MRERYGPGFGDEGDQRPSGRGAVTERLARRDDDARETDLTDEATERDAGDDTVAGPAAQPEDDQADRESSGAFEPAPAAPSADPPAGAERPGSSSIFDVGERARQEDLNRTGYEPPVAHPDAAADGPRGETTVTEPGEARDEPDATPPADAEATPPADAEATQPADAEATGITPTPVPAAAPPADTPAPEGLPEPGATADAPAATDAPAAGTSASPVGTLDADGIRNRFLDIQAGFVDEPRQAVEEAGRFVDDLLRQVADALREQRAQLAGATDEGSTEDLRLALRAYRQFVDRILGMAT
jgi:hypothetical protein